jgi:hypothetical protein
MSSSTSKNNIASDPFTIVMCDSSDLRSAKSDAHAHIPGTEFRGARVGTVRLRLKSGPARPKALDPTQALAQSSTTYVLWGRKAILSGTA